MNRETFDELVNKKVEAIKLSLISKGKEYQRNADVLHNFERASRMGGQTREKALWGMALKHYVSFMDILDDIDKDVLPTEELLAEKTLDLLNYIILCESSIKEKIWHLKTKI